MPDRTSPQVTSPRFSVAELRALAGLLIFGGGDPIIIEALRREIPAQRFADAYGWWYLLCLSALACAPVLVGLVYNHEGSYRVALIGLVVLACVSPFVWVWRVRPPV